MVHESSTRSKLFAGLGLPKITPFLFLAGVILALSVIFLMLSIGRPHMGVSLSMSEQGWKIAEVDVNGLAHEAGIQRGDKPVIINGQPAEAFLDAYKNAGVVFGMEIKELTVINEHGTRSVTQTQYQSPPWQLLTDQTARLLIILLFWITGFYAFLKRPRIIATSLLCLSGLVFGLSVSSNMAAALAIPTALEFQIVTTTIGPWVLFHFFITLPEERAWMRSNRLVYLIYLPTAVILALLPLVGYVNGAPVLWFRNVRMIVAGAGFLASTGAAIFNYFDAVLARTQQQMKIILTSCLVAIIPYLALYVFPQAISSQGILPPEFSILLIGFIPIGMAYAVVAQNLWDIDFIIRRGVIYGLITAVMAVILSIGIVFAMTLNDLLGASYQILAALVLATIATSIFWPLKNRIESWVDRLLYKDRYDYRQIIQSLASSLSSAVDFVNVSRLIVGTTVQTLNLAGGCLFVKTQSGPFEWNAVQGTFAEPKFQDQLSGFISERVNVAMFPNSASTLCSDLAFLIPLVACEKEVGILCLSQKVSRQDFSSDDICLLQGIASVAAMALHSAMLIRDVSIRDTFVSVASHELRTPLTPIIGYSDLLMRRDPPESTRKRWLKNIFDNSLRVSAMVDDLLNVSRIQSGKFRIELKTVKLDDILEETLSLIRESTNKHDFVVQIEPDLPDVLIDRDKFGQVVSNLLSNAVKYSPAGGRITLSAHIEKDRNRIVVSVADQGIGISSADKERLFTTFQRIRRPETENIRGSGLGLYIAKEWTEAMGGKIWLESELNKGSTFFVSVPLADSHRSS